MRKTTIAAVFYPFFCENKIATTVFSQCIQWTKTKETIEILHVIRLMTWEIFTACMFEIFELIIRCFHCYTASIPAWRALMLRVLNFSLMF